MLAASRRRELDRAGEVVEQVWRDLAVWRVGDGATKGGVGEAPQVIRELRQAR